MSATVSSRLKRAPVLQHFEPSDLARALRLGATLGLWVGCTGLAIYAGWFYIVKLGVGIDTHAYWVAGRAAHPYHAAPGWRDAFEYSPVFALAIRPLALLPWPVFLGVWMTVEAATYVWLTRPMRLRWRVPLLLLCVPELLMGNLYGFFALVAVFGLRYPELWAIPLLTKITPGGMGLLWFVARGEWRQLARAIGVSLALCLASYLIAPDLWSEWFAYLLRHGSSGQAWTLARVLVASGVVVVASRLGWQWLLPLTMSFSTPVYGGTNKDFAMLTPAARLLARARRGRRQPDAEPLTQLRWGHDHRHRVRQG